MNQPPGGYNPPPQGPYGAAPGQYGAGSYGPPQGGGYGPPPGGGWGPPPGQPPYGAAFGAAPNAYVNGPPLAQSASGTAVAALVLAIFSWVLGGCFLSLPAFFLARSELNGIRQGTAPVAGKGLAEAAYWVSLVNLLLFMVGMVIAGVLMAVGIVGAAAWS